MNYRLGQPYIEINSQCNLSCVYCYHSEKNNRQLSMKTLSDIFSQLKELGVKEIKISGGEPLMHPEIASILNHLKQMDMGIELVTNGTLINDYMAEVLAATVDRLVISLDSYDPIINNSTRPNSYHAVINAIDILGHYEDINLYIGVVATQKNKNVEGFPAWCKDHYVKGIIFESVHREGKAKAIFDEYCLDYDDYLAYRTKLIHIKVESPVQISVLPDFGGGCMLLESPPIVRPRIDCEGNVYLCRSFLDLEMSVGNILQQKLNDIFKGDKSKNLISALKNRQKNIAKCRKCFLANGLCAGGCAAQAYNRTGSLMESDDLCDWRIKNSLEALNKVHLLKSGR